MFLQKADLSLINCDLCTSIALTNFAFENPKGQLESIPCGIRIDINGQCHMIILENEHNPINLLTVEERKEYYNSAARGQQPATCSVCPLTYNKLQAIRHKNEFLAAEPGARNLPGRQMLGHQREHVEEQLLHGMRSPDSAEGPRRAVPAHKRTGTGGAA